MNDILMQHIKKEEAIIRGRIANNEKQRNELSGELKAIMNIKQTLCHIESAMSKK